MILSVIIPSYNHKDFVLKTIEAAAKIGIQDKEIIVIDDGSKDNSVSLIREYIANRSPVANIRLIARENRGVVKTLNEALSLAQGKYLYGVASDDIPIPEGIVSLVDQLEKNPNLQFVLGNALIMDSEDQREFRLAYGGAHRRFFELPHEVRRKEMFLHYPQPIFIQATVFRTSALEAIGGWREDIISDDFSLFLRIFSRLNEVGRDFGFNPEIMACFYRRHRANISKNFERQFVTVEQTLTHLCPSEWRDAAYLRNFAVHGSEAIRSRQLSLATRLFCSTVARVGLINVIRAASSELRDSLTTGVSRRRANKIFTNVVHEPPYREQTGLTSR